MKKIIYLLLIIFTTNICAQSSSATPEIFANGIPLPLIAENTQEVIIPLGDFSIEVTAEFTNIGSTESYSVESIPYTPFRFEYEPTLPGAIIYFVQDDVFSEIRDLSANGGIDFEICFFQNTYTQFVINDNGVVTFDLSFANQVVGGNPANGGWRLQYSSAEADIAGTNVGDPIQLGNNGNQFLLNNSIYLPGHDLFLTGVPEPAQMFYNVYGTAPNRKLVIGISEVPMFGCFSTKQTHQLIIYETTNIIETHIQNIDICDTWNGGFTLLGIQNNARNKSFIVPNRDTGVWDANLESWRFVPNGGSTTPTFAWYENYDHNTNTGDFISNNPTYTFAPNTNTIYTAEVKYISDCDGNEVIATRDLNVVLGSETITFNYPEIAYCTNAANPIPTNVSPLGGVFSIDNGGDINANTGEISLINSNLGNDGTGIFTITYSTDIESSTVTITIFESPILDLQADITACDSYTLPVITGTNLTGSESYFTAPNGGGTNYQTGDTISFEDFITYPITLYVYDETGTTPNCSDESSFNIILTEFEDSSFSYSDTYAISDTNPIPTNIVTLGGVFTINNGAVINPTTGEIDLTSTTVGETYIITYTTNGMCPSSSTFAITIVENAINYPNAVVEISGDNPIPTITISGGTFTIDNGASINETTGEVFLNTTTVNTTYTINYTYNNSRINTYSFELTVVNTLGIEDDLLNNNVSIFPNPTKNVFTLKNEGNFKLEKLEVISYLGKLIKTVPLTNTDLEKQISIKNLTTGVYFIKITSKNGDISKKLIVK